MSFVGIMDLNRPDPLTVNGSAVRFYVPPNSEPGWRSSGTLQLKLRYVEVPVQECSGKFTQCVANTRWPNTTFNWTYQS